MKRIIFLLLLAFPIFANAQKINLVTQGSSSQGVKQNSYIYQAGGLAIPKYSSAPTKYGTDPITGDTIRESLYIDATTGNIMSLKIDGSYQKLINYDSLVLGYYTKQQTDAAITTIYNQSKHYTDSIVANQITNSTFGGSVVPSSNPAPTVNTYYFATQPGTYTNMGGVVVSANSFAIISYLAATHAWSISQTALNLTNYYTKSGTDSAISNALLAYPKNEDVGISIFKKGQNFLLPMTIYPVTDTNHWVTGSYLATNGAVGASINFRYFKDYLPVYPGYYDTCTIQISGTAAMVFYDGSKNVIGGFVNTTSPLVYTYPVTIPANTRYVRVSQRTTLDQTQVKIKSFADTTIVTTDVFTNNNYVRDRFLDFRLKKEPIGTNLFAGIAATPASDSSMFRNGYYNSNEVVSPHVAYWHTVKYLRVYPGTYTTNIYAAGNAKILYYDQSYKLINAVNGSGNPAGTTNYNLTIPDSVYYIRFSFYMLMKDSLRFRTQAFLYRDTNIIQQPQKTDTLTTKNIIKNLLVKSVPTKQLVPIVSFIADDGDTAAFSWYLPIMDSLGVKSSFAIITGAINTVPTKFTLDTLKALKLRGHDLVAHTHSHFHMADSSLQVSYNDLRLSYLELASWGFHTDILIEPFGSRTNQIDSVAMTIFKAKFHSGPIGDVALNKGHATPPINSALIPRVTFDVGSNGTSYLNLCKQAVDSAVLANGWLTFAVHPQYPEYFPSTNPSGYASRRQDLIDLIMYIKSKNIQILTAQAGLDFYGNTVEIGRVNIDEPYFSRGANGKEAGTYFERKND